ncbi:helix-turn-helix transcriptional regulator [Streptomyces xanthophaeus]|uniref:helix-turn-helix transcriptional regulator n=1 Tax=Streptomyces xanthophaeus TaxID=67385 RepID=UPI0026494F8B|nr:helix-turn-helix transcriptional regulator [Streptomyces xanthophaeus]WKD30528.1 helix-turn-helix transcriptional regulator [Streptomyces xanthophaeus]
MESFADLSHFLRSHRLRTAPGQTGVPAGAGPRTAPCLLPAELARAAGLDADRYADIEDGRAGRVSLSALHALASALHLGADERAELFRLGASPGTSRLRGLGHLTRAVPMLPVIAFNHRYDITGWNLPGQALLAWDLDWPVEDVRPNLARMLFLDGATRALYGPGQRQVSGLVGALRRAVEQHPDEELTRLVAELAAGSGEFAQLWSRPAGERRDEDDCGVLFRFEHPAVGSMELSRVVLEEGAQNGEWAVVFSPEPGSVSAAALDDLLARVAGRSV